MKAPEKKAKASEKKVAIKKEMAMGKSPAKKKKC
jgi:hypothetical protein